VKIQNSFFLVGYKTEENRVLALPLLKKLDMHFTIFDWILMFLGTSAIGISKAGIKGIEMLNVLIMALIFGGKASTGVVLPLLCLADILAVIYYKRSVVWIQFWRILPPMLIGIAIGGWWGNTLNEGIFKKIMALIIVLTILAIVYTEKLNQKTSLPQHPLFRWVMGLTSGFATMLGNLAGAFSNIYFLALKLPKNEFIGTAAWVFLAVNLSKVPLQVFVWKNITVQTLTMDLFLAPAVFIGFFVGTQIVRKINETFFRKLILALTFLGSMLILFL
jgi:uncharacterized protein